MAEAATTPTGTQTSRWVMDRAHSSIWFSARHLAISTVRGWFREFDVDLQVENEKLETARIEASIDASSLDTADERRDQHLRSSDFLDAEHYRWIIFRSTGVEPVNGDEVRMAGNLTIHDVTRPVTLDVEFHGFGTGMAGERRAAFTAHTTINRTLWGLTWNVPIADALLVGENIELVIDVSFAQETTVE
jgi:polyisoprenoid-binding protein YceI